jgi:hypothetical protein
MFVELVPSLDPILFSVQIFEGFLGVLRLVPEVWILRLEFEFGYAKKSFIVVKDTSSTHQGAERALR